MPILAQQYPVYQPAMRPINNITTGQTTMIVTQIPHQYRIGIIVRLNLPVGYSLQELNQKTGAIIQIVDPTTFIVDIDSDKLGLFSVPTNFPRDRQEAQVTPVGEINSDLLDATRNVLPY